MARAVARVSCAFGAVRARRPCPHPDQSAAGPIADGRPAFSPASAWIFGARVRVERRSDAQRIRLLVANHLSWFDIVVLGGATGCAFVAKDELGHPFIHWLADQNHTVYVKRTHRKGAKDQAIATAAALERDQPVALFAEGTTGPGTAAAAVPLDAARSGELRLQGRARFARSRSTMARRRPRSAGSTKTRWTMSGGCSAGAERCP